MSVSEVAGGCVSAILACAVFLQGCCEPDTVSIDARNVEVVVPAGAPSSVRYAGAEMTNILARVFGDAVPLVAAPTEGKYPIILGTNGWSRAAGLAPEKLKRDSFCVKIARDAAFIAGCDDPDYDIGKDISSMRLSMSERATVFGVYGFLDKHAGVRFYFPGELGTVVPETAVLELPFVSYSVTPRFSRRYCYVSGAGPYPGIDPDDTVAQCCAKNRYALMLREETERVGCSHGQNKFKIADRFGKSNPEYFLLQENGKRSIGLQLCHTSKVWDIFRDEAIGRIRKGEKYVDVMPHDGMRPCRCDGCRKMFNTTNLTLSSGYATELIWSNTVSVAEAITAAGLDGGVSQMAYGTYRDIPSVEIPENVKVVLAVGGPWSESRPQIRDKQIDFIRVWAEKLKRPVAWIWTYPMKNYGRLQTPDVPQIAPRAFAKFYTLAEPYIDGSFVESHDCETLVQTYLNFYVFSKIAWDGKIDIDAVLSEHHRLMFGAGADAMAAFFNALEKKWIGETALPSLIGETEIGPMLHGPDIITLYSKIYTPEFIAELGGYLKTAAAAVTAGTLEARRVAWIKSELFDRLVAGAKKYLDGASVAVEKARRAADPDAKVLVDTDKHGWDGWTATKDMICADGSLKVTSVKSRYVGLDLKGDAALKPNTTYRLSYFLRMENLKRLHHRGRPCMEVEQFGSKYSALHLPKFGFWTGTVDWVHQSIEFKTNDDPSKSGYKSALWLRIFNCEGTVWLDGVRLEEKRAEK